MRIKDPDGIKEIELSLEKRHGDISVYCGPVRLLMITSTGSFLVPECVKFSLEVEGYDTSELQFDEKGRWKQWTPK